MSDMFIKKLEGTIELEGEPCAAFAAAFGQWLYEHNVKNYVEVSFRSRNHPDLGQIVVTAKRETGKTPHQLRTEAEKRIKDLETLIRSIDERRAMTPSVIAQQAEIDQLKRDLDGAVSENERLTNDVQRLEEDLEKSNIEIGSLRNTRNYLKGEREQNALLKAQKNALLSQLVSVRGFVASDKLCISYQTIGQYRAELLKLLADLRPQPEATCPNCCGRGCW